LTKFVNLPSAEIKPSQAIAMIILAADARVGRT
jgi:hypothetical protein